MRSPLISTTHYLLPALIVAVPLFLYGCKTVLESQRTETVEKMELRTGVSVRDTLLIVPGAHVSGSLLLPPFGAELPKHTVRSERAWTTLEVTDGMLRFSGGCDTALVIAKLYERWSKEQKERDTETTLERTVIVTKIPKWAWWSLATALLLALWRLWPLLRRLIKPI